MSNHGHRKKKIVGLYNRVASDYGQIGPDIFSRFGARMVELAGVHPLVKILDVACGRGASLLPAALATKGKGQAVGIDLAWGMLREAQNDFAHWSLDTVSLCQMDGELLGFPWQTFDFILCGFAIFFFPTPGKTLQEWKRVLSPGGRLVICVLDQADKRWKWFEELLFVYHQKYNFPIDTVEGWDTLKKPAEIGAKMAEAGFHDVEIKTEVHDLFYSDEDQWWEAKWTHGSRYALENMPEEFMAKFRPEVWSRLKSMKEVDGFHERWRMAWIIGRKL